MFIVVLCSTAQSHLRWPTTDHEGHTCKRGKPGKPLCTENIRGIVWSITADNQFLSDDLGLAHTSSNEPCWKCPCNKSDIPFNDFSIDARWRAMTYTAAHYADNPVTSHPIMKIVGVNAFTFAIDTLHDLDLGAAGHALANVLFDLVYRELPGRTKHDRLEAMNSQLVEAYKSLKIDARYRIGRLDFSHFSSTSSPHQKYPDLMNSAIKAREVRYLTPAISLIASKHVDDRPYSRHRSECLKHLVCMYDIIDKSKWRLSGPDFDAFNKATLLFLLHYNKCAEIAFNDDLFQWSQVAKHLLVAYLPEQSKYLSPRLYWAYGGESMVGTIASLMHACLGGIPAHNVSRKLFEKYRIAMHLTFSKLLMDV